VYSIVTKLSTQYGDRFDPKRYIIVGMLLAIVFFLQIPIFYLLIGSSVLWVFPFFMALNGACQSTQWPGLLKIMGIWFSGSKKGLVMGIWQGCSNVGNIVGYFIGFLIMQKLSLDWYYVFFTSSTFFFIVAIVLMIFLKAKPSNTYTQMNEECIKLE